MGEVLDCSINFDRGGRSKGTAEIVFARRRAGAPCCRGPKGWGGLEASVSGLISRPRSPPGERFRPHAPAPLVFAAPETLTLAHAPLRAAAAGRTRRQR